MSLPNSNDLKTMDYVYMGQPSVFVPAKEGIDINGMDYVYMGQPFVSNPYPYTPKIIIIS